MSDILSMLSKEEMKSRLSTLISKYNSLSPKERKGQSEDDTRRDFIEDLLIQVLEWKKEWLQSHQPIKGKTGSEFPDYWYPKWSPKIIVEAKKLKLDDEIEDGQFDSQAKGYAVSKAVNWTILTNFRKFKAWYITRYHEYPFCNIDMLDQRGVDYLVEILYWFQNDNLLGNGLLNAARERGYTIEEIDLPRDFGEALNKMRQEINMYLERQYRDYDDFVREEITQGLINRLIFIKKVEADGIEDKTLEQIYRRAGNNIYNEIKALFAKYRSRYDTDIFGEQDKESIVERIDIFDPETTKLLNTISKPKRIQAEYQYQLMDVDVLGSIYENYLAFIQKGAKLIGGKSKRKMQGIYYTPKAIVDYIVTNSMCPQSPGDAQKFKILDLACGSGSFLIGAMNNLDLYYKQNLTGYDNFTPSKRLEVFKKNIYGVDLDERAVRIAELSVYLKTLTLTPLALLADNRFSLLMPPLRENIKIGNSIIDDNSVTEKAFVWNERFEEIMNRGGFDVVIGNPPYIDYREIQGTKFLKKNYISTKVKEKYNALIVFIERGLQLLKEGGTLGFIVTSAFLAQDFGKKLRELILETCEIEQLIDVSKIKVFKDASTYPIIIILRKKQNPNPKNPVKLAVLNSIDDLFDENYPYNYIEQRKFSEIVNNIFVTPLTESRFKLMKKIESRSIKLSEIVDELTWGTSASGVKAKVIPERIYRNLIQAEKEKYVKLIKTSDIQRYHITWKEEYIEKSIFTKNKLEIFEKDKIVIGRLTKTLRATVDTEFNGYGKVALLILKKDYNKNYVLGLLNSRLFEFYYSLLFWSTHMSGGYFSYDISYLRHLPIKIANRDKQDEVIMLVRKIVALNEEYDRLGDERREHRQEINERLAQLEKQLDEVVYKIYGLTTEEKNIIDDSLGRELVMENDGGEEIIED